MREVISFTDAAGHSHTAACSSVAPPTGVAPPTDVAPPTGNSRFAAFVLLFRLCSQENQSSIKLLKNKEVQFTGLYNPVNCGLIFF